MKKANSRISDRLQAISFILLLTFCILASLAFERICFKPTLFDGITAYQETTWQFGVKGGIMRPTRLTEHHLIEPGKTYVLSTRLSYSGENDDFPTALISMGNYEVSAYVNDELLYEYNKELRGFGEHVHSIGPSIFFVSLGEQCAGKTLWLELSTPMDTASDRRMPNIVFGDYSTMMRSMLADNMPGILISGAIISVILLLVILSNTVNGIQWSYIYFAMFSMLIVLYRGMQNQFLLQMWQNPYMVLMCEYLSISGCAIPLLLSYRFKMKPFCSRLFNGMILVFTANFIMQIVLHYTGLMDILSSTVITHSLFLCGMGILLGIHIYYRKNTGEKSPFRRFIPIAMGSVMDILAYYYHRATLGSGAFHSLGNYIGLGLFITLIFMVLDARKEQGSAYKDSERSKILERVAYKDALTGLGNRAAFDREISDIEEGRKTFKSLLVVSADLNGLKKINDTMGHGAGDTLIQGGAAVMNETFSSFGSVFRTGGDEYFAFLYDVDEARWAELRQDLDRSLKRWNQEHTDIHLSIAVGHAHLGSGTLAACLQEADKLMYANKKNVLGHAYLS